MHKVSLQVHKMESGAGNPGDLPGIFSESTTERLNPESLQSILADPEGNPFEIILPDDKM
jgi:hypothetical protein